MYRVGGSTGVSGLSTFRENVRLSVQQNVICLIRDRIRMPPSSCYTTYGDFTQWAASDWVVGRTHSWLNRSDVERLNRNLSAAPTTGVDNRFTAAFLPFSSMRAPCTAGPELVFSLVEPRRRMLPADSCPRESPDTTAPSGNADRAARRRAASGLRRGDRRPDAETTPPTAGRTDPHIREICAAAV